VTLQGPGGTSVSTPSEQNHLTIAGSALAVADSAADTTYFEIRNPPRGTWTVTPGAGSSPIGSISIATPLPPPDVRAQVSGSGGRSRHLHWSFHAARGRSILLIDRGEHAWKLLRETSRSRGSIEFDPAASGDPGHRQIVAIIEQDGIPRATEIVAHYSAPSSSALRAVRRLRAVRHGSTVKVTWAGVAGAGAYLVRFKPGAHQAGIKILRARARTFTFTTALGGTVTVTPGGDGVPVGPAVSVRFPASGKPPKHRHK